MKVKVINKEYKNGKGQDMQSEDGSIVVKTSIMGVEPKRVRVDILSQESDEILLKHKPIKNKENK